MPVAPAAAPSGTFADLRARVAARVVRGELAVTTGKTYTRALDQVGAWLNTPLDRLPADLDWFEDRCPMTGFDPDRQPTDRAYQLFRRRMQAALLEFAGVHAAREVLRRQDDDWTALLAAVEPRTRAEARTAGLHPMRLKALRTFALVARAHGCQPGDIDRRQRAIAAAPR